MAEDLYREFADRYDLFFAEFGRHRPERVRFFEKLFTANRVRSVLDCACGTGHDLVLFHSLGCEVLGSDVSESMLARAEINLREQGIDIPLHLADYRELPQRFSREFDAVVCLSSSILHMPDGEEMVRAFGSMRGVLRKGGILVLTQGTTDKQWSEKPRFVLAVQRDSFARLFVIDYQDRSARYNVVDIFHGQGGAALKTWSTVFSHVILSDETEELLNAAGFGRIDFYGTLDFKPYEKAASDLMVVVAHK